MVRPVNKTILVEIIDQEAYKKTKSGIIVPNAGIMDTSGAQTAEPKAKLKVLAWADDVTIKLEVGEYLENLDPRIVFFYDEKTDPENTTKLALIREERIIGVWPKD